MPLKLAPALAAGAQGQRRQLLRRRRATRPAAIRPLRASDQVRGSGTGSVVDDVDLKKQLWHASLARWFEHGPEDPTVALVKVTAHRIQTWGRLGDCVLE